jgi:hypothetical protein
MERRRCVEGGEAQMVERTVLEEIATSVLEELGLRDWLVHYADSEPVTLENKVAATESAANLRFHLRMPDESITHIIRFRISATVLRNQRACPHEVRTHLLAGLRRARFEESTH